MITISKEDYLKAIAIAEAEHAHVIPALLAHWLSVSRPAVTMALKRLGRDGLVRVGKDSGVRLTSHGRAIAERTILRHHLIERMLIEIFDMPWSEVHDEADRLEHAVSPTFEKKLREKLGNGDTCPHGNSLTMRSASARRKNGLCLLNEAREGRKYRVTSVYDRDRNLLQLFDREGIRPGASVAVRSQNYDGTTSLTIGRASLRLGPVAAKNIWVAQI